MKEIRDEINTVIGLLLGEGPRIAPDHATILNKIAKVGSWCTDALSTPSGTVSVEISQNEGQARPPFRQPQMKVISEKKTRIGNAETKPWLQPQRLGYLFPARVLTRP
tara:strand:+ start:163 stop:486 length:324 start_codon:yes stop_codon:yes gene_type:complete